MLELREEPLPPPGDVIAVANESVDDAKATLAYCTALGLEAASVDVCTATWAAERRRFLRQTERDAPEIPPGADNSGDPTLDLTGGH